MAKYTMELRRVCEIFGREDVESWFKNYNLKDFLTNTQIEQIEKAGVWSKDKLAKKIVDHYFMREIGFETPALFRHYVLVTMNEIMERYLPLIYSNYFEYDPLSNVDFTEEYTREIVGNTDNTGNSFQEGTSNSNSQNKAEGFNINNDTPQTRITKQNIDNGIYASNTNQSETESQIQDNTTTNSKINTTNNTNSNTVEKFTRHEEGDNGVIITNQRLIKEYREIIVAIDEQIINELNSLFMGIY